MGGGVRKGAPAFSGAGQYGAAGCRSPSIQTTKIVSMTHSTPRAKRRNRNMTIDLQPGPRASTLRLILGYSRAVQAVEAPPIGEVRLVLN